MTKGHSEPAPNPEALTLSTLPHSLTHMCSPRGQSPSHPLTHQRPSQLSQLYVARVTSHLQLRLEFLTLLTRSQPRLTQHSALRAQRRGPGSGGMAGPLPSHGPAPQPAVADRALGRDAPTSSSLPSPCGLSNLKALHPDQPAAHWLEFRGPSHCPSRARA